MAPNPYLRGGRGGHVEPTPPTPQQKVIRNTNVPGKDMNPNRPQDMARDYPMGRQQLALRDPAHVKAVQQFLNNRGYKISVDGIAGPLTRAAIADWQSGEKTRNPTHFNVQHGLAAPAPKPNSGPDGGASKPSPSQTGGAKAAGNNTPLNPMGALSGMVTALLQGGAGSGSLLGTDLADDAAAPQTALASQLQSEIDQLPNAKAQALANIANWYGQVKTSEGNAAMNDQTMANNIADAITSNTQGIAGGLGGSAMAGSGQINAVGANDANSMKAIGASDKQLASDLGPIFDLEMAGQKNATSGKFDQGKIDLQNQLATAQGQASADKANALMQIVGANNKTNQDNFSNEAGLLNTLASLQISGANAETKAQSAAILNALHASEIAKNKAKTVGGFDAATGSQKQAVAQKIISTIASGPGKLANGYDWPGALRQARQIVRMNGWNPLDPGVVNTIIAPALQSSGVQFNPNVLLHP